MPRRSLASSLGTDQRLQHQRLYFASLNVLTGRTCATLSDWPDSIFLTLFPRPTLFASFKYVGNAFDEDMQRMAANPKVQEWWQMTDRMQESPVEGAVGSASGPGWWGQTEEVFYME